VQRAIAAHMIDRFNERLRQLTALFGERVIHVDARAPWATPSAPGMTSCTPRTWLRPGRRPLRRGHPEGPCHRPRPRSRGLARQRPRPPRLVPACGRQPYRPGPLWL
jgi:hypothetical protein